MRSASACFLLVCAGLLPPSATACSVSGPEPFVVRADSRQRVPAPPTPRVTVQNFVAGLADDGAAGSCAGLGHVSLRVVFDAPVDPRRIGLLVRAVSGVRDPDLLPAAPQVLWPGDDGSAAWSASWFDATPDPDGHLRWMLEVVAVSRSGEMSAPVTVCAATDASCD